LQGAFASREIGTTAANEKVNPCHLITHPAGGSYLECDGAGRKQ